MKKPNAKKPSPEAAKLVDELVKKEIDALRVRSTVKAGHPQLCCLNCRIDIIHP